MSTMKVKPWGEDQGDYVVIEESDFNPEIHQEFEPAAKKSAPKKPAAKKSEE